MERSEAVAVVDALERFVAETPAGRNADALNRVKRTARHLRRAPGSNEYVLGALEHWAEVFYSDGQGALYAGGPQQVRGFMLQQLGRMRSLVAPSAL